ncbi:MAG: hypothetical protein WCL54_03590 [Clostridia bacterium]
MIKVWYGEKGTGKTKALLQAVNDMVQECDGDVVFIDHNSERMYDLKHQIRYVNTSEFKVDSCASFAGFVSGIVSADYDIGAIFIDGLNYITKADVDHYQDFFDTIRGLEEKFKIDFYISMSGITEELPEYLKSYIA